MPRRPWGHANLRGKKEKLMNCGCCVCINRKDKTRKREWLRQKYQLLRRRFSVKPYH